MDSKLAKTNFIVAGSTVTRLGLRLLSTVILTRLLDPSAFALVGLTASILFLFEMLSDTGTRSFVLRHEHGHKPLITNCLWTFGLIRSLILFVLALLLANPVANLMEMPDLAIALYVAAPIFLLHGARSLAPFVDDRNNKPIKPILVETVAHVVGVIITVLTTIIFESQWCIVIGLLYAPVIHLVLTFTQFEQQLPKLTFDKPTYLEIINWAKFIIPSSMITIFLFESDKFIFGKLVSAEMLGFYFLASNLAAIPNSLIMTYARRVVGPAVSAAIHGGQEDISTRYYQTKNAIMLLIAAGVGGLAGVAELMVDIIYDDRYAQVAYFLGFLLIRSLLCIYTYPLEVLLVVRGKIRTTLIANLLRLVWIAVVIFPAYTMFDTVGLILAFVTSEIPAAIFLAFITARDRMYRAQKEIVYLLVAVLAFYAGDLMQGLVYQMGLI